MGYNFDGVAYKRIEEMRERREHAPQAHRQGLEMQPCKIDQAQQARVVGRHHGDTEELDKIDGY